ncbi:hypothetical protein [Streptomyces sp. NPDC003522]
MPALALVPAVLDQSVRWKYGTAEAVGLLLPTVGIRSGRPAPSSAGSVVLALLAAGPAVSS